mgnify:CR=1 FL=1
METNYEETSKILKAISDPKRLQVLDIISCQEMCACDILDHFDFTQPTLSHHMKVLGEANLINVRKDGLWSHYSINKDECNKIIDYLTKIFNDSDDCICYDKNNCSCK